MLIYYRIIPWIIQYEFVLDSRMHLHLWDRRAGDTFWSTDVSAFDFWGILQMLSRHLGYLHLSSLTSADAFQTGGHINLHLHLLFFCFADTFPVSGVSYLAFILSCRCFPGIWCILSCFSFVLQMLSRYLVYPILLLFWVADAFSVSAVSAFVFWGILQMLSRPGPIWICCWYSIHKKPFSHSIIFYIIMEQTKNLRLSNEELIREINY